MRYKHSSALFLVRNQKLVRYAKMDSEQFFAALLALFGQNNRLSLSNRIENHPFLMQPSQGVPIVPLPCSPVIVVNREKKERENRVVDLVLIVIHVGILTIFASPFNRTAQAT